MHVMVDLETMGNGPDASITQIGAVAFDLDGTLGAEFSADVSLASSVKVGLRMEPSTLTWWMGQDGAAREAWVRGQNHGQHIHHALVDLDKWLQPLAAQGIWSHGTTFDLPILASAYRACNLKQRWSFRDARDTRTLFWLCAPFDPWLEEAPENEVKHNAVDDARRQARAVIRAVAHLKASNASVPQAPPPAPAPAAGREGEGG